MALLSVENYSLSGYLVIKNATKATFRYWHWRFQLVYRFHKMIHIQYSLKNITIIFFKVKETRVNSLNL